MGKKTNRSKGFTLIAALLILVLLSGVAAGVLFLATNEARMSGNDQEENLAYYGAESGMEKLDSDLATLYQSYMVPTTGQIQTLATSTYWPTSAMVGSMNYSEQICFPTATGCVTTNNTTPPPSGWNTVSAGANQGLYAEIVPMNLQVTATRPAGASVNITRRVEVALIPVFQFGVFCGYDCSYFPGPDFSFGGRVHTNMNLFLATGGDLVFNDKVQAFKQIVMDQLENGWPTSNGYTGTVYISKAYNGCPLNTFPPTIGTFCATLPVIDGSWSGGYPGLAGSANGSFPTISGSYNNYVANSLTGVANMQLQFVQNSCVSNLPGQCTDPIAIVRKPVPGESATSTLGSERLYNKAQIRILISDDPLDLHPERGTAPIDAQDVRFPNAVTDSPAPFTSAAVTLTAGGTEPVGFATVGQSGWVNPYTDSGLRSWGGVNNIPLIGELTTVPPPSSPTNMTGPWIRVEICIASPCSVSTNWQGVTQEWLKLGFSRIFNNPPTTPGSNAIDPNAILILQQLRPSVAQSAASAHGTASAAGGNFYPINFYDTREGEMRDNNVANTNTGSGATASTYSSCSVNGIMNAVELDVGNLARWLNSPGVAAAYGTIPGSGSLVNYSAENGYVLYFSDHRGMLPDPNASTTDLYNPRNSHSGVSGIEDVINSGQSLTSTTPDGVLEPATYYQYSPEDVDMNNILDNWGEKNIGYGFGLNFTSPLNPFQRINVTSAGTTSSVDCASYNTSTGALLTNAGDQEGMANPVSGARHVLKLIDGGMSNGLVSFLPVMPAASGCVQSATAPTACGGFTIASENPVYIQGNYNSQVNDPFWNTANNTTPTQTPHSAASIIADSVTLLSNSWSDMGSLMFPTVPGNRAPAAGANAYYRTAIAGGKNIPFPQPTWSGVSKDFGTDGGLHNFLRYLENLGNITLYYDGSLVSMYYSEYNTGVFKCCTTVYSPPTRKYYFDVLFLNPNNLPPATPEFQDVVNLSYHQNFTPR